MPESSSVLIIRLNNIKLIKKNIFKIYFPNQLLQNLCISLRSQYIDIICKLIRYIHFIFACTCVYVCVYLPQYLHSRWLSSNYSRTEEGFDPWLTSRHNMVKVKTLKYLNYYFYFIHASYFSFTNPINIFTHAEKR